MGDSHYNRWGGKNNSWGNSNKKNNSDTNDTRNNTSNNVSYEPSKLFNILAGGVLLFLCGALGLSLLSGVITNIKGATDAVDTVKDIVDTVNNQTPSHDNTGDTWNAGNTGSYRAESIETKIIDELGIDEEDVSDVLEYLTESLEDKNKPISEDMVILDYSAIQDSTSYKDNVISKVKGYTDEVTFVFINRGSYSGDDALSEIEKTCQMVSDNMSLLQDTGYNEIITGGLVNIPETGNYLVMLTYTNK